MPVVRYLHPDGTEAQIDGSVRESVMKAAAGAGVDGIVGECSGQLMYATCHVTSTTTPHIGCRPSAKTRCLATPPRPRTRQSRLSCQIALTDARGPRRTTPDAQV